MVSARESKQFSFYVGDLREGKFGMGAGMQLRRAGTLQRYLCARIVCGMW